MYIFWFLHQTTTHDTIVHLVGLLYIFWFLHQTTTDHVFLCICFCCISFDSYIKPQLHPRKLEEHKVVYLLIPTSNHNLAFIVVHLFLVVYLLIPTSNHNPRLRLLSLPFVVYLLIPTSNHNHWWLLILLTLLYIFWFLHQTTTVCLSEWFAKGLYIFWFLHQTTTCTPALQRNSGCISFDSYIKPQLESDKKYFDGVVYLLIPTSNHNLLLKRNKGEEVVYLLIPTSNHNLRLLLLVRVTLYIFWFLHQTTTFYSFETAYWGCISFDSYIKPQL